MVGWYWRLRLQPIREQEETTETAAASAKSSFSLPSSVLSVTLNSVLRHFYLRGFFWGWLK